MCDISVSASVPMILHHPDIFDLMKAYVPVGGSCYRCNGSCNSAFCLHTDIDAMQLAHEALKSQLQCVAMAMQMKACAPSAPVCLSAGRQSATQLRPLVVSISMVPELPELVPATAEVI